MWPPGTRHPTSRKVISTQVSTGPVQAEGKRTGAGEGILALSSCLLSRQLPRE